MVGSLLEEIKTSKPGPSDMSTPSPSRNYQIPLCNENETSFICYNCKLLVSGTCIDFIKYNNLFICIYFPVQIIGKIEKKFLKII